LRDLFLRRRMNRIIRDFDLAVQELDVLTGENQ
jgi:hypothetical protein